jgi:Carboxypeptidase regulatory-like domain
MTSCVIRRRTCIALCLALCASVAASSAAQSVGGTLLGTVVDNSEAILPGATVTATNTATAVARTTVSDGRDRYSLADLPPGAYGVSASLSGFQTVLHRGIRLVVGNPSVVDFSLGISGVAETVTVSGAAPVVDTVSTAIGTVVEQKQMPIRGKLDELANRKAGDRNPFVVGTTAYQKCVGALDACTNVNLARRKG